MSEQGRVREKEEETREEEKREERREWKMGICGFLSIIAFIVSHILSDSIIS